MLGINAWQKLTFFAKLIYCSKYYFGYVLFFWHSILVQSCPFVEIKRQNWTKIQGRLQYLQCRPADTADAPLYSTYIINEREEIKLFAQDDNDDEDKEVNK